MPSFFASKAKKDNHSRSKHTNDLTIYLIFTGACNSCLTLVYGGKERGRRTVWSRRPFFCFHSIQGSTTLSTRTLGASLYQKELKKSSGILFIHEGFKNCLEYTNLYTKFQSFWPTDAYSMFPHIIICPQSTSAVTLGYVS